MDKNALLKEAVIAIKAGDKATGQRLLLAILKENLNDENALLWLSATTDDPTQKRQCLERVLAINPDNEPARQGLAKLAAPKPKPQNKNTNLFLILLAVILLVCCAPSLGYSILNYLTPQLGFLSPTPTRNLTPTRPFVRSATWTPVPLPTPVPTRNPVIVKARWDTVDIRALVKNPDKYIGEEVHYRGEVFTIEEGSDGTAMQVWVDVPGGSEFDREAMVILFRGNTDPIYTGTKVEFWGYCTGTAEGINAFGGIIRQPSVMVEYLTYFR